MDSRSLGHRAPLLWVVVPLLAGIAAGAPLVAVPLVAQLGTAAAAAIAALALAGRHDRAWTAALCTAAFCAGTAAYTLHRARLAAWDDLPPRELRTSLRIERLFSSADPRKIGGIGQVVAVEGPFTDLRHQRIYFSALLRSGDEPPARSAVIAVRGLLTPLPANAAADSFDGYLSSAGVNFRLARAHLLGTVAPPTGYYRFCAAALDRFNAILGSGIAEKRPALAALLRAMMLGETRELTEDQHTIFMQSGTMHLFAISGLNIAVIAGAIQAILGSLRLPPWLRFAVGTPLLWLFVDITGASPSAVRAFAMAVFVHAAFVCRRPVNPFAALVGSAALVLALAPLQLFSASFLMSYSIVVALLILGLPLSECWLARWTPWRDLPAATLTRWQKIVIASGRWLIVALAIGVATTLVSVVTSVEYFRLLTPGALVANLVLIPTAMIVTAAGFLALLFGLLGITAVVVLCNHASALMLLAIEAFVRFSVHVPGAFGRAHFRAPWIAGATLAALLLTLLFGYRNGWRGHRGIWWPPFAVVGLALVFGVRFS